MGTRLAGSGWGVRFAALVYALGKVKRGCQVADLCQRQRYFLHGVGARIQLFNGHAIIKRRDDDVFLTVCCGIIHKGDDRGVEVVLNGKHGRQGDGIGGSSQEQLLESGGLFVIVPEVSL